MKMEKIKDDELKSVVCIYKILNNVNGKVYIGSTVNLKQRINSHITKLNEETHINSDLQKEWNIYNVDNFSFEIVENIEDKSRLPIAEYHYIEEYKKLNGVYNKSNPLEEYMPSRYNNIEKLDRGQNKKGIKYETTQRAILTYLDDKFTKQIVIMQEHIVDRIYFIKEQVDEWIIKNIDDEIIKKDERLKGLIHRWYNKHGFHIVYSSKYKLEIKELYNKEISVDGFIIVTRELHEMMKLMNHI